MSYSEEEPCKYIINGVLLEARFPDDAAKIYAEQNGLSEGKLLVEFLGVSEDSFIEAMIYTIDDDGILMSAMVHDLNRYKREQAEKAAKLKNWKPMP